VVAEEAVEDVMVVSKALTSLHLRSLGYIQHGHTYTVVLISVAAS
jgi:hypothetical protein